MEIGDDDKGGEHLKEVESFTFMDFSVTTISKVKDSMRRRIKIMCRVFTRLKTALWSKNKTAGVERSHNGCGCWLEHFERLEIFDDCRCRRNDIFAVSPRRTT